jgi:mono/diheme cytochrome c family protein
MGFFGQETFPSFRTPAEPAERVSRRRRFEPQSADFGAGICIQVGSLSTQGESCMRTVTTFLLLAAALALGAGRFVSADEAEGAVLYKKRCQMCHAANGKGFKAIKSQDFTDPDWQAKVKDEELIEVTKKGVKGTAMPGFADKLNDEEIKAVVAYIRKFNSAKK